MIIKAIQNALRFKTLRKWDKTYWAVDIHGTMIEPNFSGDEIPTKFYPGAIEVMQQLSLRKDIVLILYTCSHPHEIVKYKALFASKKIEFNYYNENPEVSNGAYGCYDSKPYFNVLMEDKAGFDPYTDWQQLKRFLGME